MWCCVDIIQGTGFTSKYLDSLIFDGCLLFWCFKIYMSSIKELKNIFVTYLINKKSLETSTSFIYDKIIIFEKYLNLNFIYKGFSFT